MKRLMTMGVCMLAALALGVVGVATASAAPQYGRCIKKAKSEGSGYSNANCTTAVGSNAKFEWAPGPGPNNKFTATARFVFSGKYKKCVSGLGELAIANEDHEKAKTAEGEGNTKLAEELNREAEIHEKNAAEYFASAKLSPKECEELVAEEKAKAPAELETVTGQKIVCGDLSSTGEYTGTKTIGNLKTTFSECVYANTFECNSTGAAEGEIDINTLKGELGVIEVKETKKKVGVDLVPSEGTTITEFKCGIPGFLEIPVSVTGSVIHEVKGNSMLLEENESFSQSKGKQKPEKFEEGPLDVLMSKTGSGEAVQAGQTLRGLLVNEEKIEVNTVI